jgi:hypothetical protein
MSDTLKFWTCMVTLAAFLTVVAAVKYRRWHECRAHFSLFYCLTDK